jgi:hypothetical protein
MVGGLAHSGRVIFAVGVRVAMFFAFALSGRAAWASPQWLLRIPPLVRFSH